MNPQELTTLAHFKYPTHYAYVFQYGLGGRIHCLKYGPRGIRWETFDDADWTTCTEYMINNLPDHSWGFSEDSE